MEFFKSCADYRDFTNLHPDIINVDYQIGYLNITLVNLSNVKIVVEKIDSFFNNRNMIVYYNILSLVTEENNVEF